MSQIPLIHAPASSMATSLSQCLAWQVQAGKLANEPSANGDSAAHSREADTLRAQLQAAQERTKDRIATAVAVQARPCLSKHQLMG